MSLIETVREIPDKVATGLRDLKRGYSDKDLKEARRIHRGEVTPDDRVKFRLNEEGKLLHLMNMDLSAPLTKEFNPLSSLAISYFGGIRAYLKAEGRLTSMPDNEVDRILIDRARANLQSWHQLQRTPKIVNPHSPFIR